LKERAPIWHGLDQSLSEVIGVSHTRNPQIAAKFRRSRKSEMDLKKDSLRSQELSFYHASDINKFLTTGDRTPRIQPSPLACLCRTLPL